MGNPSWGNGYHKGRSDGQKAGSLRTAIIAFGLWGSIEVAKWGYHKYKSHLENKYEKELSGTTDLSGCDDTHIS